MLYNPKVSVVIPSYNHARFLPQALDSALSQTYRDFEILIADDGSSDDSLTIARDYAARYPSFVRVFTHADNGHRGISATCNLCLGNMRGRYWAGLASDDVWYPDKLERQVAFLDDNPAVGFVYGYAHIIDEAGELLPGVRDEEDISLQPDPLVRLIWGNVISGGTCLIRRECWEQLGVYDETLVYGDWELWIRFLSHWQVGYLAEPLAKYRHHSYNTSLGLPVEVQLERAISVMRAVLRKAPAIGGALARPPTQALLNLQLAHHHFLLGETKKAAKCVRAAFKSDSSLSNDEAYITNWLDLIAANTDLRVLTFENLPFSAKRRFGRRLAGAEYLRSAQEYYWGKDLQKAGKAAFRYLVNDPFGSDTKIALDILGERVLGSWLMSRARRGAARRGQHP